jgi:site-specific DNA-methyltransferase (adenine-specific)
MTNTHPTVKPLNLLQYLCRLITPPGGTVLDCFAGSGSTGVAALREGFRFIGIEREPEYFEIAQARVAAAAGEPSGEATGQESPGRETPATIPMPRPEPERPIQPDLFGGAA